jgi:hypothetical protein
MQKKATIFTIILVSILFIGVTAGIYLTMNASYKAESDKIKDQIAVAQSEMTTLEALKDSNGYAPVEVVRAFFTEVKADSSATARLYLAPEVQEMDTAATLKLGSDLGNVSTGEYLQETDGEDMKVTMTFISPSEEESIRTFSLSKYNGIWKIVGVVVE